MNKIKLYIVPNQQSNNQHHKEDQNNSNYQQYNADLINKNIANTIKKFSSERSLFFSNLNDAIIECNSKWNGNAEEDHHRAKMKDNNYSHNNNFNKNDDESVVIFRRDHNNNNSNREMIRNSTNSQKGWKESLLKRCKSTKELFQSGPKSNNTGKNCNEGKQNPSFRNSYNLDDFDKYYLFSGNRKNIVKELRKNFENQPKSFVELSTTAQAAANTASSQNVANNNNTRKTKRNFFDIFSNNSGKSQANSVYQQQVKESYELRKSNNQINRDSQIYSNGSQQPASIDQYFLKYGSSQLNADDQSEPFYLHDKYGVRSRQNLNSVFYGATNGTYTKDGDENKEAIKEDIQRKKVLEKYGDRVRESESFSKFLSHTSSSSSTPKLKAIHKIDPDSIPTITPKNNPNNLYGPRRNSTSNLDDLQRCEVIIENNFESLPPPLNPTFQQQYLNAKKQLESEVKKNSPLLERKNLKNYKNSIDNSDHLKPKMSNLDDDLYILNNNKPRKFTCIKSDSANNVSDFDVEYRSELGDFVDPKWCSSASINGYGQPMQTYYRQFGKIRKELDLEQKIDLEIKMREGSAKLLAACNNNNTRNSTKTLSFSNGINSQSSSSAYNTQVLEAAKNLLTSNERMTAYMAELQRRKKDSKEATQHRPKPTGKISLSEIRMPLMWRDTDHFKNKGDHRRFAVFCLAKIGTEIFDTTLLCPVDRNLTDISFPDSILFTNITPDFELKLEVYAVMMEQDLSIASTPRKIKNTIHSSISRTVGKRLAANLKDELNNTKIGPKFDLIATASLSLAEASLPHTHDLQLVAPVQHHPQQLNSTLPLFGHFCCRLAVQPDCLHQPAIADELGAFLVKTQSTAINDCYARIQGFRLDVWDDEKSSKNHLDIQKSIEINRDTKLKLRGDCDLAVLNMEEGVLVEAVLRTRSVAEQTKWSAAIRKTVKEHQQWSHIVLSNPMQLASPESPKGYYLRSSRQRSLYDQVPILNAAENETNLLGPKHENSRPSVHEIFALPNSVDTSPTLNDFRSRTSSSGRSSHSSSLLSNGSSIGSISSRKSHWPLFGGGK